MKPLKPVMAALLAASSAVSSPGISYAGLGASASTPTSAPVKPAVACPADEKNPVNALTCLIQQKPEVRAAIGARLAEFVQSTDASGRDYLTKELRADKATLPGVLAVAQKWPETNKDKPGVVAVLYFVIGPSGNAPAWAQSTVLAKTLKPGMMWAARLSDALATRKWTAEKKLAQSGAAEAAVAFLNDAADQAQKVLDDPRTKKDIQLSIGANDTTAPVVPTTGPKRNPLDGTGAGFSFNDMYVKGAEVVNVYGPNDDGYRTLSVKVYTTKDASGNLISQVGIVDITAGDITSPTLPKFISVAGPGDTDVVMRDGGRHYAVSVKADGTISVTRKGATPGADGSLTTSVNGLIKDRNDQIVNSGTVMIGGQPYYVLGQGGAAGSYMFFSKGQMDSPGNHHPELMGDVMQVISDGSSIPTPYKKGIDLGQLADGSAWHLEYDVNQRIWKVMPGAGDKKSDAAAAPPDPSAPVPPDPTTPPDPNAPVPPAPPTTPTAPTTPLSLDQAVAAAKADKTDKTQVWVEDAGNDGFDAATRAKIRIMSNVRTDKMTHFKVLFDPSLGVKDAQFEFQAINKDVRLLHVRGVKQFVALEYGTGTQYYDLQNFANYVQHVYDSSLAYAQAGSYAVSNGQMQDVTSMDIVEDALTRYMKVKPGDPMLKTVRDRIAAHAKDAGFIVNGDVKTLYLGVGEVGRTIWPNDVASGDTSTNEKLTGLRGPGTAVDVTGGEPGDFKKEMDLGSGRVATLVKSENHAAIYLSTEEETYGGKTSTVKVWSVMLEYKKNNLDSRSKALPVFGSGHDRYSLPAGIHMQGLPGLDLPDSTQLMMLYGSNQESGAIAAYRSVMPDAQGGSNVRDKKGNCGGPVLWWGGVTQPQAQAACESDSKIK